MTADVPAPLPAAPASSAPESAAAASPGATKEYGEALLTQHGGWTLKEMDAPTPPAQVNVSSRLRGTDLVIMGLVAVTLIFAGLHAQARVLGIPDAVLAVADITSPVIAMLLAVLRPLGSIKVPG